METETFLDWVLIEEFHTKGAIIGKPLYFLWIPHLTSWTRTQRTLPEAGPEKKLLAQCHRGTKGEPSGLYGRGSRIPCYY